MIEGDILEPGEVVENGSSIHEDPFSSDLITEIQNSKRFMKMIHKSFDTVHNFLCKPEIRNIVISARETAIKAAAELSGKIVETIKIIGKKAFDSVKSAAVTSIRTARNKFDEYARKKYTKLIMDTTEYKEIEKMNTKLEAIDKHIEAAWEVIYDLEFNPKKILPSDKDTESEFKTTAYYLIYEKNLPITAYIDMIYKNYKSMFPPGNGLPNQLSGFDYMVNVLEIYNNFSYDFTELRNVEFASNITDPLNTAITVETIYDRNTDPNIRDAYKYLTELNQKPDATMQLDSQDPTMLLDDELIEKVPYYREKGPAPIHGIPIRGYKQQNYLLPSELYKGYKDAKIDNKYGTEGGEIQRDLRKKVNLRRAAKELHSKTKRAEKIAELRNPKTIFGLDSQSKSRKGGSHTLKHKKHHKTHTRKLHKTHKKHLKHTKKH